MTRAYFVQVNDYMTPARIQLTKAEANTVAYALKEIAKADRDALVEITREEDGEILFSNCDEWSKTHSA